MASAPPAPGDYRELTTEQRQAVRQWMEAIQEQQAEGDARGRKVGLWVHGKRRHGTSTLASTAAARALEDERCGIFSPAYITAHALSKLVKSSWDDTRTHDDAAWLDAIDIERRLNRLWVECGCLWVDDLHLNLVTGQFVERHLYPNMELRVKSGLPVVVATSIFVGALHRDLQPVVEDLFVIVEASRGTW
jgi:hypothetical protein